MTTKNKNSNDFTTAVETLKNNGYLRAKGAELTATIIGPNQAGTRLYVYFDEGAAGGVNWSLATIHNDASTETIDVPGAGQKTVVSIFRDHHVGAGDTVRHFVADVNQKLPGGEPLVLSKSMDEKLAATPTLLNR